MGRHAGRRTGPAIKTRNTRKRGEDRGSKIAAPHAKRSSIINPRSSIFFHVFRVLLSEGFRHGNFFVTAQAWRGPELSTWSADCARGAGGFNRLFRAQPRF